MPKKYELKTGVKRSWLTTTWWRRSASAATDHRSPGYRAAAPVERVTVLGRRGPVQATFTTKELDELGDLAGATVIVDGADVLVSRDRRVARGQREPVGARQPALDRAGSVQVSGAAFAVF